MADTAELGNRLAIAEAMAEWALEHAYTAEDLEDIDPSGRAAVARLARISRPALPTVDDYVPSDETWQTAMSMLSFGAAVTPDDPDPFAGFPQF